MEKRFSCQSHYMNTTTSAEVRHNNFGQGAPFLRAEPVILKILVENALSILYQQDVVQKLFLKQATHPTK